MGQVIIRGATAANLEGVKRVSMMNALREEVGLSCDESRDLCYRVLAGDAVEVRVRDPAATRLVARLRDAGLDVVTES